MAISSAPSWFYKDSQGRLVNSPSTAGRVLAWGAIVGLIIDDATIDPYAAASGAGKSIFQRTQSAAVGSGLAGGSYSFEMGLGDGAGVQGLIKSNGGVAITPATAAVGLFIDQNNDAVGLNIDSEASSYYGISITGKYGATITQDIANGRGLSVSRNISEAGTYSLVKFTCDNGTDTKALLELQQDGTGPHITTGATNQNLDIAPNGTGEVWFRYNSIQNFHMSGAAVAAYAGAATVAGQGWFVQLQNGGAAAAAEGFAGASGTLTAGTGSNAVLGAGGAGGGWSWIAGAGGNGTTAGGSGGDVLVVPGLAGTGGTGTNGKFIIRQPGGVAGTDEVQIYDTGALGAIDFKNTNGILYYGGAAKLAYNTVEAGAFYWYASTIMADQSRHFFGTNLDWGFTYDETTTDTLQLLEGAVPALAIKGSAITGFSALAGVAGNDLYIAMQSGLDSNMPGGSLDWSGGTAHGSGQGGSLLLRPGGSTTGLSGVIQVLGTHTHTAGEGVALELAPTWNASGTAGEICLKLNPTKSAVGSGVYLGIDARGWAAGDAILGVPVDAGALGAYYGRITAYVNGVGLKVIPLYEVA